MTKLESMYKTMLFNKVKETEMDFKRILRASINRHKTTKVLQDERILAALLDKIWIQFLDEVKNPKVGVISAIHNAFNKYN